MSFVIAGGVSAVAQILAPRMAGFEGFALEHMRARLSAGLVHCVLYIKQMYTVSYFEIYCDDGIPEATREYFNTYHEAQAYAKSFEDWEDVRVDKVPPQPAVLPF